MTLLDLDHFGDNLLTRLRGADRAPVIAAVSGGIDSTALALGLAQLRRRGDFSSPITIAHVDHGSHATSGDAARHVAALARRLDLRSDQRKLDLGPRASEATLRAGRYRALAEMAAAAGAATVLTAHHADDQLETVLFRCLRGAGPRGLAGIPRTRPLVFGGAGRAGPMVLRPMLSLRRQQLQELLERLGESPVVDPTNRDLRHARNRIRALWLPQLRRVDANTESRLLSLARRAEQLADQLDVRAARWRAARQTRVTEWRIEIAATAADRGPVVAHAVGQATAELQASVPWSWIARTEQLLAGPAGQRVHGPGGLLAERTRDGLTIIDPHHAGAPPVDAVALPVSGEAVRFGSTEWRVAARRDAAAIPDASDRWSAVLDGAATTGALWLRCRRPGDVFQPLGRPSPIELRRFVQNRHLPRYDRDRRPLVVDSAGRVVWIPGVEIAEFARHRCESRQVLVLNARPHG